MSEEEETQKRTPERFCRRLAAARKLKKNNNTIWEMPMHNSIWETCTTDYYMVMVRDLKKQQRTIRTCKNIRSTEKV